MNAPIVSTGDCTLEIRDIRDELMSLTLRMVGEYSEVSAWSVMRCVARAVRRALMAGTPREQIPVRAEHAARRALAGRPPESMGPRRTDDRPTPVRGATAAWPWSPDEWSKDPWPRLDRRG